MIYTCEWPSLSGLDYQESVSQGYRGIGKVKVKAVFAW